MRYMCGDSNTARVSMRMWSNDFFDRSCRPIVQSDIWLINKFFVVCGDLTWYFSNNAWVSKQIWWIKQIWRTHNVQSEYNFNCLNVIYTFRQKYCGWASSNYNGNVIHGLDELLHLKTKDTCWSSCWVFLPKFSLRSLIYTRAVIVAAQNTHRGIFHLILPR